MEDYNVARFLAEAAKQSPGKPAVVLPGRRSETLDFSTLDQRVDGTVRYFHYAGIKPGQRVLLLVKPGLPLIQSAFALFRLGAIPVVIDPGLGRKAFLKAAAASQVESVVAIPLAALLCRLLGGFLKRCRIVVIGSAGANKTIQALAGETPRITDRFAADAPAAILFTSGSTGAAKGVLYTHGMFNAQVALLQKLFHFEPGEIDFPMLPVFTLFNPAFGMTTVVPPMPPGKPARANFKRLIHTINHHGVTNSFGSPVLWRGITRACSATGTTLPSLRRVLIAGAPMPPSWLAALMPHLPHARVYSPYGATEALPVSLIDHRTVLEETAEATTRGAGTCVGMPCAGVSVKIIAITPDVLNTWDEAVELPQGEIGEIVVSGAAVTREYDGLPEATRRAKIDKGNVRWHRMGDCGYLDTQGRLWFCGRVAERVTSLTGTLYTDCCEAPFLVHPQVSRVALIGIGAEGKQTPALVVEPKPDSFPRKGKKRQRFCDELKAIAQSLPLTRPIERFYFERALPVDVRHNAKIHRLQLRQRYSHAD